MVFWLMFTKANVDTFIGFIFHIGLLSYFREPIMNAPSPILENPLWTLSLSLSLSLSQYIDNWGLRGGGVGVIWILDIFVERIKMYQLN